MASGSEGVKLKEIGLGGGGMWPILSQAGSWGGEISAAFVSLGDPSIVQRCLYQGQC